MSSILLAVLTWLLPFALGCFATWVYLAHIRLPKESFADLIKMVRDIEDTAIKYWSLEFGIERASELELMEIRLKSYLQHLSMRLGKYKRRYFAFRLRSSRQIIRFRQSITDGPFERPGRAKDIGRSERIHDSANSLVDAIEDAWKLI